MSTAIKAYHGSDKSLSQFISGAGDEGGACFSAALDVAACYGPKIHHCDLRAAKLYPMTIKDWQSGDITVAQLQKRGFDGIRVAADPSFGISDPAGVENRTFHHDLFMVWNGDKISIEKIEHRKKEMTFLDLPEAIVPQFCRLTPIQFQALSRVNLPEREYRNWFHALYETPKDRVPIEASEALRLDAVYDFLRETHDLTLRDDGRWEVYHLTPEVEAILGPETEIVLYHVTSSAVLPKIAREGLRVTHVDVNRQGESPDAVFLSSVGGGTPMALYGRAAERVHGGESVCMEVSARIRELQSDPHDADIESGRTQFIVSYVAPAQILNLQELSESDLPPLPGLQKTMEGLPPTVSPLRER